MNSSLLHGNSSTLTSKFSRRFHGFSLFERKKQYRERYSDVFFKSSISTTNFAVILRIPPSRLITVCSAEASKPSNTESIILGSETEGESGVFTEDGGKENLNVEVRNPNLPAWIPGAKLSLSDQAFFLLAFIASTTSIAFTSLVIAAVPTLFAMGRAATSLSKLADTAREELPSTMAAIRLSGMEISDLTLELSDLSQEIAEGVNKSAQAVKAAEAGIRQIGAVARHHTISMIQERANLPIISLQPVVAGAAKKTSNAVGRAKKTFMNIISRGEVNSDREDDGIDRVDC